MIGILAHFRENDDRPLGKQTHLVEGFFAAAASRRIELGLFGPETLLEESAPQGHVFRDNRWERRMLACPRVIYDRLYSSITGFDPVMMEQKRLIGLKPGMRFLNPPALAADVTDKQVFALLMRSVDVPSPAIIPVRFDDPESLRQAVQDHPGLVLKPRFGRMGRGIIRLTAEGSRIRVGFNREVRFADNAWHLAGLVIGLCRRCGLKPPDLIAQESIEIRRYRRRFYDIRVLVQRIDGESEPVIAGEVARVSGADANVPNIDQGGLPMPLDTWLETLYGCEAPELLGAVRRMALAAWTRLETIYGPIGELGIDLLIDTGNRV